MKLKKTAFFLLLFLSSFLPVFAQSVDITPTIEPEFFAPEDEITITYDVTGTPLGALSEAWLWMWVPSSGNANVPSNINPASSNPALTAAAKFTKSVVAGNILFSITLTPADFVSLSDIEDLGMLIKGNDWGDGQSVDNVVAVGGEFRIVLDSPEGNFAFYNEGEIINIFLKSSQNAELSIFVDNTLLIAETGVNELLFDHEIINDGQVHTLYAIGSLDQIQDTITHTYSVAPTTPNAPLPANVEAGINYNADETQVTLVLTAPTKNNVFVIGEFNDWQLNSDYLMNRDGDDFWLTIDGLTPQQEYRFQYLVDGVIKIADPYTEKVNSPFDDGQIIDENRYPGLQPYPQTKTSEAISYFQTGQTDYNWTATDYVRPEKADLVIYELLVRDFTDERTFQAVIDRLDYLEDLGINAIELMPVMEFEGNLSWGYNPAFMLAVDKFYGTENNLKKLIDEAHKRDMAIILDIVVNHAFGRSSLVRLNNDDVYGPPTAENVWLNRTAKHDFNVGYDFNHESDYTKYYLDRLNEFWIKKYNIDGYRFDLSKGITQKNTIGNVGLWGQYDASRIALLKRMADHIWSVDEDCYIILEHFAENSEERELANYGMMLWGNMNHDYRSLGKGNPANISWAHHEARGWNDPHAIAYMESHDEERVMWEIEESGFYTEEGALNRLKLNAAFFFLIPGPKMIWQFGELGYGEELNNDRLGVKPTHWEYLDDEERVKVFDFYKSMINLKTETPYVAEGDFEWKGSGFVKWLNLSHPDVNIAAFGNFRKTRETDDVNWPGTGTYYHYFTGDTVQISNPTNFSMTLEPGELQIYTSTPIDNYIGYNPLPTFGNPTPEPNDLEKIKIYPTVTQDKVIIEFPADLESLKLYSADGKFIYDIDFSDLSGQAEIDLTGFSNGVYFISSKGENGRETQRFVKTTK